MSDWTREQAIRDVLEASDDGHGRAFGLRLGVAATFENAQRAWSPIGKCKKCGKDFRRLRDRHVYCGRPCRPWDPESEKRRQQRIEDGIMPPCGDPDCGHGRSGHEYVSFAIWSDNARPRQVELFKCNWLGCVCCDYIGAEEPIDHEMLAHRRAFIAFSVLAAAIAFERGWRVSIPRYTFLQEHNGVSGLMLYFAAGGELTEAWWSRLKKETRSGNRIYTDCT